MSQFRYHAFISYRHADNKEPGRQWATWLHQAIETYEVPADLVGQKNQRGEEIPARIYPIFRDEEELPAHADLGYSIVKALDETRLLVVLCSPRAVASTYVADEIAYFKQLGRSDSIIAAMIDGEPNASWDEGKQKSGFSIEDECFPLPLQFEYDANGDRTDKRAEPIAADFRINNEGVPAQGWTSPEAYRQHLKSTTKLDPRQIQEKITLYQKQLHLMQMKIIAGILGVPLGELTRRDKEYQLEQARLKAKRLRQWLAAVAMLAVLAVGAGVIAYFQRNLAVKNEQIASVERDKAEEQRQRAEENEKIARDQRKVAEQERNTALTRLKENYRQLGHTAFLNENMEHALFYLNEVRRIDPLEPRINFELADAWAAINLQAGSFLGDEQAIHRLHFTAEDTHLVSQDNSGRVRLYDPATSRMRILSDGTGVYLGNALGRHYAEATQTIVSYRELPDPDRPDFFVRHLDLLDSTGESRQVKIDNSREEIANNRPSLLNISPHGNFLVTNFDPIGEESVTGIWSLKSKQATFQPLQVEGAAGN